MIKMKIKTFPLLVSGIGFFILGVGLALFFDAALGIGVCCYGLVSLLLWQNLKHLKRIQRLEQHVGLSSLDKGFDWKPPEESVEVPK